MPVISAPRLLLSLLSLAMLGLGLYLPWLWWWGFELIRADGSIVQQRGETWQLVAGLALLAWSLLGRFVIGLFLPAGRDEPVEHRGEARTVAAPDGSVLHVEHFGPAVGPTIILTHGWGLNSTAPYYSRAALAGHFRVVTWDLPGLGRSKGPTDGKYSIDRFAQALGAVINDAGAGPVLLVGHSIGGMTTQTVWRACPASVREKVRGVVLVDTTHENPLRTMWLNPLWLALRRPLIEPMSWLTIALFPIAWLMSWQGYLSGSNHLAMRLTGFGRYATRGQVDLTARLACKGSPAVQAKGNLAMFNWSITDVLPAWTRPP